MSSGQEGGLAWDRLCAEEAAALLLSAPALTPLHSCCLPCVTEVTALGFSYRPQDVVGVVPDPFYTPPPPPPPAPPPLRPHSQRFWRPPPRLAKATAPQPPATAQVSAAAGASSPVTVPSAAGASSANTSWQWQLRNTERWQMYAQVRQ